MFTPVKIRIPFTTIFTRVKGRCILRRCLYRRRGCDGSGAAAGCCDGSGAAVNIFHEVKVA